MGRKYPDGLAEGRQAKGSKTNEIMATINENLKRQLAKKMYHFVKYFPVRIKNVGEDAIENRKLVWGFKDADREITLKVAQMTASYRSDLNLCISIKMLSNSVQIELFIILWVTKLIHNKQPMYAVLDKDTIKNEILPHLSVAKRGFQSKSSLIEVINAILYKLKTGCQWEYLPVKELFSGKVLKYGAVFHNYNKWRKKGEWKSLWLQLLDKHRSELDMSSVDLDGSHTPAIRGGEEVGYQGRKKRKTTNALYLTDRKGLPLAMSVPKSGEHHDTHNIVAVMQNMMEDMAKANIRTDGLFLNVDAGFDCAALRSVLKSYGIVSNICINKRNGTTNDSIVLDELLYRERYSIERTNAWMDSFRTILNRFDTTLRNWESWNYIAFSVMLLRKCARKRKV